MRLKAQLKEQQAFKVSPRTIYPLPPCTFLGLRPKYVTGIGALTMYVGSEQCSYFEQSTEHRYITDAKCSKSTLNSGHDEEHTSGLMVA